MCIKHKSAISAKKNNKKLYSFQGIRESLTP